MNIAIIGRTEILFDTIERVISKGHKVSLIITSKEAPEYLIKSKDFENLANKIGAKFIHTAKLDTESVKNLIKSCGDIDIALSFNYSSIISEEIINMFKLGILNAHGGDLPRYRGNACQAWAILNGESKIGLCIHSMIGGEMDSGSIISRDYLNIDINTKIGTIWEWKRLRIPSMFLDSAEKLYEDPSYCIEKQSVKSIDALRCYPRIPEDGKIDWNKSNVEILRLINASNKPYSGAYCFYENKKMIIWDAEIFEDEEIYLSEVGQLGCINSDGSIIVITGTGKLKINLVEFENNECKPSKFITSIRKRLK